VGHNKDMKSPLPPFGKGGSGGFQRKWLRTNMASLKLELERFFDDRAMLFLNKSRVTLRDLCYVSGRDYRIWTDSVYGDLIASIVSSLDLNPGITLLEVGCASGFLAQGLSPHVGRYTGIDLSPVSLKLAGRLPLTNAEFKRGDGTALPFAAARFDRAVCYDVFTNISDLNICRQVISEMARVTRPGGRFLIGSLAAASTQAGYEERVREVTESLPPMVEDPEVASRRWVPWMYKLLARWHRAGSGQPPTISCHYFEPAFFEEVGKALGLPVEILPIHSGNPYVGYRFNALFRK
jgi:SAM-dependent methyltransferase